MCEYHFRKWHTSQTSTQHFTLSVLVKEKARLGPPCVYIATGVIQWLYKRRAARPAPSFRERRREFHASLVIDDNFIYYISHLLGQNQPMPKVIVI